MPAAHPSANPFKNCRMCDAARDGMLITVKCGLCRRSVNFWATDLLTVLGPDHQVHHAPFPCSKCRTSDYLDVRWNVPAASDLERGLTVRRPVKKITKWIWRDERA